jgi:hypothetical protein
VPQRSAALEIASTGNYRTGSYLMVRLTWRRRPPTRQRA